MPHSSVAALHAPVRTTTGTEVTDASKLYLQQLGEHCGALQAARRISICKSDKLKQSISTHTLWSRYHDGIAPALLAQAGMKKRDCWAGRYGNAHPPNNQKGSWALQGSPSITPSLFVPFPWLPLVLQQLVGLCTHKQTVLPQQLGQSTSLTGFLPALAQNLTIQVKPKFL